jgi:hypothetical protein
LARHFLTDRGWYGDFTCIYENELSGPGHHETAQNLLSELKTQVNDDVAAQLGPHATRLDTLHDDQVLLKKQLKELTENLLLKANPFPSPPPPAAAPLTDLPLLQPPGPISLSMEDINSIERAKCTHNFAPITSDDLDRMKHNQTEEVSTTELLSRTRRVSSMSNSNLYCKAES